MVPSHLAAVRRFIAPGAQLGEDGGRPARGVEQLLGTMSTAQTRGRAQMCSATRYSDREMWLTAVQRDGRKLYYAPAELQADRELVLAAVQQDGLSLSHASPALQADREVVLSAVRQHAYALMHASVEMQADREVVLTAVQRYHLTLNALDALQQDADARLRAQLMRRNPVLQYASAELQRDSAVLKASNHIFGELKVLRTLASVQECGRQMNNCLADYGYTECRRHILVKLDGDDGAPLAVGSFANGEWEEIRYAKNGEFDARGGGNRACGRGGAAAPPPANAEEILSQFGAFLPALKAFSSATRGRDQLVLKRNRWLERARAVLRFFKRVCVALLVTFTLLERYALHDIVC